MIKLLSILVAMAALTLGSPVHAQAAGPSAVQQFTKELPNVPGKSVTVLEVSYAPGGKSSAHRHAGSAFIYGYVLAGAIRTQAEGRPVQTIKAGGSFYELPGDHHVLGENASQTEPARFLAVFIVDTKETTLTVPDR